MQIKIKRIDNTLPLPEYKTAGSVGFDLYSRVKEIIKPGEVKVVPANIIIEVPSGFMLMITARSSLARKKGLMLVNGVGTIDQDYNGPNDELLLSLFNYTQTECAIEPGERLAQGIFVHVDRADWQEVEIIEEKSRGGFGSTGLS